MSSYQAPCLSCSPPPHLTRCCPPCPRFSLSLLLTHTPPPPAPLAFLASSGVPLSPGAFLSPFFLCSLPPVSVLNHTCLTIRPPPRHEIPALFLNPALSFPPIFSVLLKSPLFPPFVPPGIFTCWSTLKLLAVVNTCGLVGSVECLFVILVLNISRFTIGLLLNPGARAEALTNMLSALSAATSDAQQQSLRQCMPAAAS